jgi:hypothetical protein
VHVPGVPGAPLHAPVLPLRHSVSDVHPHEPPPACGSHVPPMLLPEQDAHTPLVPHAVWAVPAAQKPVVPPSVISQHPSWHAWVAEHAVTHVFVATSHAKPDWQSAALAQPHWSPAPPSVSDRHCEPVAAVHTLHVAPGVPHVPGVVSELAHVGSGLVVRSQHVPLQGMLPEHVEVH